METRAPHPVVFERFHALRYADGVERQRATVARLAENPGAPGVVMLVEHSPVITCGRSGDGSNLLVPVERLAADGIEYHRSGRGGDVTYHGPGQWTVYPILRLAWYDRDLHHYLRLLEEVVVRFLSLYGVAGRRRPGLTGVWVDGGKVAAVGVAVTRWITWHGFALNINTDLPRFTRYMHPCGITSEQGGVASLESVTGRPHSLDDTLPALRRSLLNTLNLSQTDEK